MFESLGLHSQTQVIKQIIRSYLFIQKSKANQQEIQQYANTKFNQYIETANLDSLESYIKQFQQCQYQQQANIKLLKNVFCLHNPQKKAQFLCFRKQCDKHAILCGEETCKCTYTHQKCNFICIGPFLDRIISKLSQQIPKQTQLYFQAKQILYEHMVNRISQERQILRDWQQDNQIGSEKSLFLYGFNQEKAIICHSPKVVYGQKLSQDHLKCGCFPTEIKSKDLNLNQRQHLKTICNFILKKYSSIINYFDQKIDKLQYHKGCANLSPSQFWFLDFLKNKNNSFIKEPKQQTSCSNNLSIIPGRAIHFAMRQKKEQEKNSDLQNFTVSRLRKIWKCYSEKLFRQFIEGKLITQIFSITKKVEFLCTPTVQELKIHIDKIVQSLNQIQECLYSKNFVKKTKKMLNVDPKQLKSKLKKYKGRIYDQVYIINDRQSSALNDIKSIEELGNLRNVTKLEIKWCQQMQTQAPIRIIELMPHLKQLALLGYLSKLPQNFLKKLCQLKQLTSFYIFEKSHPQYFRYYSEDQWFLNLQSIDKNHFLSIEELLELSKLPKLENIQIGRPCDPKSTRLIKNMKVLKHLSLFDGMDLDLPANLMVELLQKRDLRTLSLLQIKVKSKYVNLLIANNPYLSTIIIMSNLNNVNINDETVQCMANLIKLQTLCINSSRKVTGKHLEKLNSLIMLQITNCNKISKKEMKEALKNMQKLQHLNLSYNSWVDDELILNATSCKELTSLDIFGASVSGEGLKHLKVLTRLSLLICGDTQINGRNLIELAEYIPNLTRLSIWGLDVSNNELLAISAFCQAITHLDIRRTDIQGQILLKIPKLKVIRSGLDEYFREKLNQLRVKTYKW